ncbi:hypothetical protein [Paraburkholderia bannensis]|uniref:hypothetical protein n=1 Tax=Paraburkholderia bannensis TaxID=765414 RepID=UPI002AB7BF0F|nr:hypothetical protein [Paraburkholderia bannensis]
MDIARALLLREYVSGALGGCEFRQHAVMGFERALHVGQRAAYQRASGFRQFGAGQFARAKSQATSRTWRIPTSW